VALVLLLFAALILDFPVRNDLAVTSLFAAAFIVDGILRILTAHALRYAAWKSVVAFGLLEFALAALIITPAAIMLLGDRLQKSLEKGALASGAKG
jgi:uncharacterized membrane protein HdeD (DUF308 family)